MNHLTMIGRCTKDPEVRYSQGANPVAIARFSLAVNRRFKRQGEPDADFFNCTAFGKTGEFVEKYMKKGGQFGIVGRLQNRSWEDQNGQKRYATDIIVEEIYFAGGKEDGAKVVDPVQNAVNMFPGATVVDDDDDDMPF